MTRLENESRVGTPIRRNLQTFEKKMRWREYFADKNRDAGMDVPERWVPEIFTKKDKFSTKNQ